MPPEKRGHVLVEASETVWASLTEEMSDRDILRAIEPLDIDDQAYMPRDLTGRLLATLDRSLRARVPSVVEFDRDRIDRIIDVNILTVRADVTLATVQRFLRHKKSMPNGMDKIFITDEDNLLLGELPLTNILLNKPKKRVEEVINSSPTTFQLNDKAEDAAGAFERYNLISAAVIDAKGKLIGRVTIEDVVNLLNEENESNIRRMGGISQEERMCSRRCARRCGNAGPGWRLTSAPPLSPRASSACLRRHHLAAGDAASAASLSQIAVLWLAQPAP
nr:Magnesium transporter MgtE [Candidatus Pantoea persica]